MLQGLRETLYVAAERIAESLDTSKMVGRTRRLESGSLGQSSQGALPVDPKKSFDSADC